MAFIKCSGGGKLREITVRVVYSFTASSSSGATSYQQGYFQYTDTDTLTLKSYNKVSRNNFIYTASGTPIVHKFTYSKSGNPGGSVNRGGTLDLTFNIL